MKAALIAAVSVVAVAATVVGVRLALEDTGQLASVADAQQQQAGEAPVPAVATANEQPLQEAVPDDEPMPEPVAEPEPPEPSWAPDPAAVESLRRSMEEGDPRAPPIARRETEREMPTEEELADPDLYLQYEARQQQKVYASFYEASEKKIADLEAVINQARAEGGVSEEQLAEGEEKLRRLKEMRAQLEQQYPELVTPEASAAEASQ